MIGYILLKLCRFVSKCCIEILCFSLIFFRQIIMFQFGLGTNAYYVILELYAQGNIVLADSEYMVMTLLRSHRLVNPFHVSFNVCGYDE